MIFLFNSGMLASTAALSALLSFLFLCLNCKPFIVQRRCIHPLENINLISVFSGSFAFTSS